ncbi:MAG TPA: YkgJ family cysteine cluster protein [Sandaracinaceae bacterium]
MPSSEYAAVRDKVDAFTRATAARRHADLACRAGCTACCEVQLEVSDVEADAVREAIERLDAEVRARLSARAESLGAGSPCVMLEDGRCVIYEARPLVCRTQGHALRYPAGTLPPDAVRASVPGGEVTWCPLNYAERPPAPADVLDAERVDVLLALVNRRASDRPLARTPLAQLARGERR